MTTRIPPRLQRLCDDAAIFPPGNMPLEQAVRTHVDHSLSDYRKVLGPFIVPGAKLDAVREFTTDLPDRSVWLAVTVPSPAALGEALAAAISIPAIRLAGAEVAIPDDVDVAEVIPALEAALRHAGVDETEIYVEVPRDERRIPLLDALADSDFYAKFRTGGVEAHMYPDAGELADAILGAVSRHLPFKATAGLHHAIRNTDPEGRGFEQHGFLNLFVATDAARQGKDREQLIQWLEERDGAVVAAAIRDLTEERAVAARASFTSFGTCSILEPLDEMVGLGLIEGAS
ncbi:MAG: hypothetical protein Q4G43_06080 [Mobilicoccus sp.]|nr:hypothetical protein [Mobilicoccus sp.]